MKLYQVDGTDRGVIRTGVGAKPAQLGSKKFRAAKNVVDAASFPANTVDDLSDAGTSDGVAKPPVHHARVNNSFLATIERKALRWLAERTPAAVVPDHLTLLGVIGAVLVMAGFVASRLSPWFVSVAFLGLGLNWLGDSLDGTLARFRKTERPDFGYFLDHSCDLISQTFIFVGLGLSPFFTLFSALLALSMYLLMTSFTYLKVLILKTHHLSYYGVGATELRLMLGVWALFALWFGPNLIDARFMDFRIIDLTIFGLWSLVFVAFMWKVWSDVKRFRPLLDQ